MESNKKDTSPWHLTATGEIGVRREPMLSNELLLRSDLGKRRMRSYTMPTHWIYGLEYPQGCGTVGQALRGWDLPTDIITPLKPQTVSIRNYVALNKDCVQRGIVTAPEQRNFRQLHDIRKTITKDAARRFYKMEFPIDTTFGMPVRPSTPIQEVIANKFGTMWVQEKKDELVRRQQKENRMQHCQNVVYKTKANMLSQYQQPTKEPELWKLPRFTKSAQPHLETFRSEAKKNHAMAKQELDKVPRLGTTHQGIYTAAYH